MRIHCLENVDKALQFLKEQRVHLENMGSHDIVDGNHRLTLGLIWTIILRFQVRDSAWPPGLPAECEPPCKTGLPFQGDQKDQVEMASQSQVCCTSRSAALGMWQLPSPPSVLLLLKVSTLLAVKGVSGPSLSPPLVSATQL